MLADAEGLASSLGSSASAAFRCSNITEANLSRTGILWLNDVLFPDNVRAVVLAKAVEAMPDGSTIVTFGPLPSGAVNVN